jgi:hypothetical protein
MPNIKILSQLGSSEIVQAIVSSNKKKIERDVSKDKVSAQNTGTVATRPQVTSGSGLSQVL